MIKFTRNSLILTLCTGYSDKKAFRACHSSKYSKTFDSLPEHLVHEWSRLHGTNILRTIFFYLKEKKNIIEKKTTLYKNQQLKSKANILTHCLNLAHEWSRLHWTNILRTIFFYLKEKTTTLEKRQHYTKVIS